MVSALYVDPENGPYADLIGSAQCWGIERDARAYNGPGPVVAHPPCKPWGRLSWSWANKNARDGLDRSAEKACAPRAVEQVRAFGGVLEHPDGSRIWAECGLPAPMPLSVLCAQMFPVREFTILIEQCDWGFPARKRTRLFFSGVNPRSLPPMPPPGTPTMCIGTSREDRERLGLGCLPKTQRHITTPSLARWLVDAVTSRDRGTGRLFTPPRVSSPP